MRALTDDIEKQTLEQVSQDTLCLEPLIVEITAPHQARLNEKKVQFAADIPGDTIVLGDREIVAETLDVLIGNATDFCPDGGTIKLSLTEVTDSNITLRFFNTGPALPEDFHLDGAKNDSTHEGNGVGLADAYVNLKRMGASLEAKNEDGGVAFYITFQKEKRDDRSKGSTIRDVARTTVTAPANDILAAVAPTGTEG